MRCQSCQRRNWAHFRMQQVSRTLQFSFISITRIYFRNLWRTWGISHVLSIYSSQFVTRIRMRGSNPSGPSRRHVSQFRHFARLRFAPQRIAVEISHRCMYCLARSCEATSMCFTCTPRSLSTRAQSSLAGDSTPWALLSEAESRPPASSACWRMMRRLAWCTRSVSGKWHRRPTAGSVMRPRARNFWKPSAYHFTEGYSFILQAASSLSEMLPLSRSGTEISSIRILMKRQDRLMARWLMC